jgi:hypothetical protein
MAVSVIESLIDRVKGSHSSSEIEQDLRVSDRRIKLKHYVIEPRGEIVLEFRLASSVLGTWYLGPGEDRRPYSTQCGLPSWLLYRRSSG